MTTKKIRVKEIIEIQKELCELGILEEYVNYRTSKKYLSEFLKNYSNLSGQYSYVIASVLLPLFKRLEEKYPNMSHDEQIVKSSELAPVIRAMLYHEKVFALIKKVSKKGKDERK